MRLENKKIKLNSVSVKLLFGNSAHFAKVNIPEISQNALIAKVSTYKKTSKLSKINEKGNKFLRINKLPLQKLLIFCMF